MISKFKIGDEVETTEEYKKRAEELNPLLTTTQITPYIRGKVTSVQEQTDYKTETTRDGYVRSLYPQIEIKWISVEIDGEHLLNETYLQKVLE